MLAPIVLLGVLMSTLASAQSLSFSSAVSSTVATTTTTTTANATTTAPGTATMFPAATLAVYNSSKSYLYEGCYNETTGYPQGGMQRALAGGTMNETNDMTPEHCFKLCNGATYAGLEYGRECWCAAGLSTLSDQLPAGACSIGCTGNATMACGGEWHLTLYKKSANGAGSRQATWNGAAVIAAVAGLGFSLGLEV